MILVVCALTRELGAFAARPNVKVLAGGVGPVEAAIATSRMLARGDFAAVVNAGIAGAFRGDARIGQAVLVTHETFADFGLEGDVPLTLPGGATLMGDVVADPHLIARCASLGLARVRGLTVTQTTTSDATAARLQRRYGAEVESMEGFAVLRAATVATIPAIEVRGISNYVGERANSEWNFAAGARAAVAALDGVLGVLALETSCSAPEG